MDREEIKMKKEQIVLEARREEIERLIEKISPYETVNSLILRLKNRSIYLGRKIRELK